MTRHLERAAAQAFRAYRRARWLHLVHDCDVSYQEPGAPHPRTLRIRGGETVPGGDQTSDHDDGTPARARIEAASVGPDSFDRDRYDRLRILTSELKRILRDGGEVSVITRSGRRLGAPRLRGIFEVI